MTSPSNAQPDPGMMAAHALACMRWPAELFALGTLTALYGLVYGLTVDSLYSTVNIAGPAVLAAILLLASYRMIRKNPITIWTPLFWFRIACAAYFGIGALIPHIGSETTKIFLYGIYMFSEATNVKVNLLYCFGIFLTLTFSNLSIIKFNLQTSIPSRAIQHQSNSVTNLFLLSFLLVGGALRYLLLVPYTFGLMDIIIPGSVLAMASMYYVGIYMLVYQAVRHGGIYLILSFVAIPVEIIVSVASFAKTELMFILIFSFLGYISKTVGLRKILVGSAGIIVVYTLFQPLVGYGRDALVERYGEIRGAGLGERWGIVQDYLKYGAQTDTDSLAMARLSYVSVNAYVVDQHDAGVPGRTLSNAVTVIVPRALWPEKPIITQLGQDLNYMLRGRYGSAMGVGHFAEAYWNFGWWGFAPFMAVLAFILTVFSRISVGVMARKDWLFLPVVFLGVNMGIRVDGHFVPDIIGAAWMALVLGTALWLIRLLMPTIDEAPTGGVAASPALLSRVPTWRP